MDGMRERRDCGSPGTGSEHTRQPAEGELEDSVYKINFLIPERWPPCYMDSNAAKTNAAKTNAAKTNALPTNPRDKHLDLVRPASYRDPSCVSDAPRSRAPHISASINQGVLLLPQQR